MKYIAVDLGSRRIGLAVSDNRGIIAQPLTTLTPTSDQEAIHTIASICVEQHVGEIVLGVPYSASQVTQEAYRNFGKKLHVATNLSVHEWDETFTTKQAQNMVAFSDRPARKTTTNHRDNIAAAIILQEFLDDGDRK
jgi:putative holliday junction resolvase